MQKFWTVKKGNTSIRKILIKDAKGVIVENLATAEEIKFQIKKNKTGAALVEKAVADPPGGIDVLAGDDLGKLKITLLPNDTGVLLKKGDYFMAIQVKRSDTDIHEVKIKIDGIKSENFRITQDIIQS